jgi:dUTP pyrophosphatase
MSIGGMQTCLVCGLSYWPIVGHTCPGFPGAGFHNWSVTTTTPLLPLHAQVTVLPGGQVPEVKTGGSVGFDFAASEDAMIGARSHKLVSTGLIIKPPMDYWLMIAARSSLIKRGLILANGVGIVDPDYCGPDDVLRLSLYNVTEETVHIKQGERLGQGFFLPMPPQVQWMHIEREELTNESRGGFGSTGK